VTQFAVTFGRSYGGAVKMYKNLLSVPTDTKVLFQKQIECFSVWKKKRFGSKNLPRNV